LEECPDGVFVEDVFISVSNALSVLTRPGAAQRQSEVRSVFETMKTHCKHLKRMTVPSLDGGDVLQCPASDTIFVGRSSRTTHEGIKQLAALLSPLNKRIVPVPISNVLHLKSAVTALPSGELIAWEPGLTQDAVAALTQGGKRKITFMPEEAGAHVVLLDDKTLVVSAAAPRSISILQARGFKVIPVDISEFEKLEGCVTCLSVRCRE